MGILSPLERKTADEVFRGKGEKYSAVTRRRRRGRRRRSLFVYARACVISEGRLRVIGVHRRHRRRGVCAKRGAEDNDKFKEIKDPIREKKKKKKPIRKKKKKKKKKKMRRILD